MSNRPDFESVIREELDKLKPVPPRNPRAAARGRARFLAQAVAASEARRNKGWGFLFRAPRLAINMVVTLLVIAGLFIGGGTTVKAAQDDLPNEPLYGVKLWSEDISLRFQSSAEAKVDRLMELAQTRVQEMERLIEAGQTPPDQVGQRFEQHIEQTLKLCGDMNDTALDQKLLQVRDQLVKQDRALERLQAHAAQGAQPLLAHARNTLRMDLQVVNAGLQNRADFRKAVHDGLQYDQTPLPATPTMVASTEEPTAQATPQPTELASATPTSEPTAELTATPQNNTANTGNSSNKEDKDKKDKDKKDKKDKDKDNNSDKDKDTGADKDKDKPPKEK